MKTAALIILGVALALLVMGCSSTEEQTVNDGGVVLSSSSTVIVEHEADENALWEFEVRLTESGFFPATFNVQAGDTVRLVFLLDEQRFISIDGLGVAEKVQSDMIEFVAAESGEYSLLCLDCGDVHEALIVVD